MLCVVLLTRRYIFAYRLCYCGPHITVYKLIPPSSCDTAWLPRKEQKNPKRIIILKSKEDEANKLPLSNAKLVNIVPCLAEASYGKPQPLMLVATKLRARYWQLRRPDQ
jgi:hypothetical protein